VVNREAAQQANKLPGLRSVDLIAAEHVGERIQNDEARLDALYQGDEAAKDVGRTYDPGPPLLRAHDGVVARERYEMKVCEVGEVDAEANGDGVRPAVQFVDVVFSADEHGRARFGAVSQPRPPSRH
jgi:hypothetical protein